MPRQPTILAIAAFLSLSVLPMSARAQAPIFGPAPVDIGSFSSSLDLVLAALPLKMGYVARVPGFSYDDGQTLYDASVSGETVVGGVAAWSVDVKSKDETVIYAISKVDHTNLRAQLNSAGLKMSMTQVTR